MHFPPGRGSTERVDMRYATWSTVLVLGQLALSCKDLGLNSPVGTWGDQVDERASSPLAHASENRWWLMVLENDIHDAPILAIDVLTPAFSII